MKESILEWMKWKGVENKAMTFYKSKLKNPEKSKVTFEKARSGLAWAITRSINKNGIRSKTNINGKEKTVQRLGGTHFFTEVVNDGRLRTLEEQLSQIFQREVTVNLLEL